MLAWSQTRLLITLAIAAPKSEVIFNFMFDFINRAASIKGNAAAIVGLSELMPHGDWRARLETAESAHASSDERKAILVEGFGSNLAHFGKYGYVAETTVLRPVKDRPLYCLFYATRHEKGIEVFRDCQVEALKEQSRTRAAAKVKHEEVTSGQGEIFESLHDMGPDDLTAFLDDERRAAEESLLKLTPIEPDAIRYDKLYPSPITTNAPRSTFSLLYSWPAYSSISETRIGLSLISRSFWRCPLSVCGSSLGRLVSVRK